MDSRGAREEWTQEMQAGDEGTTRPEHGALTDRIDRALRARVELLRRMGVPTMQSALSTHRAAQAKRAEHVVDALLNSPLGAKMKRARSAGRRVNERGETAEAMDEESLAFVAARNGLVEGLGFSREGVGVSAETRETSAWVVMQRGNLRFSVRQHLHPREGGIAGQSRITKLCVSDVHDPASWYANFDGGWDTACLDPSIQREIDEVVAALG